MDFRCFDNIGCGGLSAQRLVTKGGLRRSQRKTVILATSAKCRRIDALGNFARRPIQTF